MNNIKTCVFRRPALIPAPNALVLLALLGPLVGVDHLGEYLAPNLPPPPTASRVTEGDARPNSPDLSKIDLQMALGNPDHAIPDTTNKRHCQHYWEHYLMRRPQLAISYNDSLRFPNWVSWHLSHDDIGTEKRGNCRPDLSLPQGFTRVRPSDYTDSGYDRGHNCPSQDRSASRADNDAVFWMTNITPQAHGLNAGPWKELESYCRKLAQEGSELFIITGHGFSTNGSGKMHKTIGSAHVAVPSFAWKIVVVVPPGPGSALSRITSSTRVIAVRIPNISTVSGKQWKQYCYSVHDIEMATGFDFFDKLPQATAQVLKSQVDSGVDGATW